MASGALYAPKYVENKLKFFPAILEAVVFGRDRKMCTAMINIDLGAVSAWAERNNISYASYQELAAHPKVCEMIRGHVEEVNRSVAADPVLAGCQIHRFLVLHKELQRFASNLNQIEGKPRQPQRWVCCVLCLIR